MKEKQTENKLKWGMIAGVALLIISVAVAATIYVQGPDYTDYEEQQMLLEKAEISQEEAEAIALEAISGTVLHTSIDEKDWGKIIYQVSIQTDTVIQEVTVNARSGEVENVEVDTDD